MLKKLSLTQKRLLLAIYIIVFGLLRIYSFIEKNYFLEGTECDLLHQTFESKCIFAIYKDGPNEAYFTANGESIIYVDGNVLKIKPVPFKASLTSGSQFQHPYRIQAMGISRDRKKVAVCVEDLEKKTIAEFWVWDVQNMVLLKRMPTPSGGCPVKIEFSPNDSVLGFTMNWISNINLLNWKTGELKVVSGSRFSFSPSGDMIAVYNEPTLELLKYPSFELTKKIQQNFNLIDQLAFSPDGSLLAAKPFSNISLWRTDDGLLVDNLDNLYTSRCDMRFASPEKIVTCAEVVDESFVFTWFLFPDENIEQPAVYSSTLKTGSQSVYFVDVSLDESKILVTYSNSVGVFISPEGFK
ncbi:MAG: WD40 repeat domain-containing protein [Anaerolineales bacterium]